MYFDEREKKKIKNDNIYIKKTRICSIIINTILSLFSLTQIKF